MTERYQPIACQNWAVRACPSGTSAGGMGSPGWLRRMGSDRVPRSSRIWATSSLPARTGRIVPQGGWLNSSHARAD